MPLPPIRKEARTDVQLTVQPLREKLHPKKKKKIAEFFFALRARSWARVHVWQLHVDILPAAYSELQQGWGRKKVKSDSVAAAERGKSAHGPPTAAKNRRPQHRIAQQKRRFRRFWSSRLLCAPSCWIAAARRWSSAYIRYSMTCRTYFLHLCSLICAYVCICTSNDCDIGTFSFCCIIVTLFHFVFALVWLLSLMWQVSLATLRLTYNSWSFFFNLFFLLSSISPGPGQCTGLVKAQQVH